MPPRTQHYIDSLIGTNRPPSYGPDESAYHEYADDDRKNLIQEPQYGMPSPSSKGTPTGYPPAYPPVSEYASDRGVQQPKPKQMVSELLEEVERSS